MKFVIYLRTSTALQDNRTQEQECLKYIQNLQYGKPFKYQLFSDPETSSRIKRNKRLGLVEMLKSLRKGDHVVIFKLDRLSRDVVEMVEIYREIVNVKGCNLHSLQDPDCSEFIVGLMGVLAQKERSDISMRIKAKLVAKKDRGERVSRWLPYGYSGIDENNLILVKGKDKEYSLKPGLLLPDSFELEALSKMCQWFDSNLSYREIVGLLNESGYRNRQGNPFHLASVYRILARTGRKRPKNQAQNDSQSLLTHAAG